MVKEKHISRFKAKEQAAMDLFQKEMDQYGLKVSRYNMGLLDSEAPIFGLTIHTESVPIKGRAKLINKLREAGYMIDKEMTLNHSGLWQKSFFVTAYCNIPVEGDDLLDYTGPADIAGMEPLKILKRL